MPRRPHDRPRRRLLRKPLRRPLGPPRRQVARPALPTGCVPARSRPRPQACAAPPASAPRARRATATAEGERRHSVSSRPNPQQLFTCSRTSRPTSPRARSPQPPVHDEVSPQQRDRGARCQGHATHRRTSTPQPSRVEHRSSSTSPCSGCSPRRRPPLRQKARPTLPAPPPPPPPPPASAPPSTASSAPTSRAPRSAVDVLAHDNPLREMITCLITVVRRPPSCSSSCTASSSFAWGCGVATYCDVCRVRREHRLKPLCFFLRLWCGGCLLGVSVAPNRLSRVFFECVVPTWLAPAMRQNRGTLAIQHESGSGLLATFALRSRDLVSTWLIPSALCSPPHTTTSIGADT